MTKEELFNKCENILKTLPLAYYLKAKTIKVTLSENESTSYFDPTTFEIVVSFKNVLNILPNKKIKTLTDLEIEKTIRCLLYHEVSHAILTPKDLKKVGRKCGLSGDLLNIIEDERIETIFANYYLRVDFKENIKALCPLDKDLSKQSFEAFVFNALRLDYSPYKYEEIRKLFNEFLMKTIKNKVNYNGYIGYHIKHYSIFVSKLKDIFDEYIQLLEAEKEQSNKSNENTKNVNDRSNENQDNESETNAEDEENNGTVASDGGGSSEDNEENIENVIKEAIDSFVEDVIDRVKEEQNRSSGYRYGGSLENMFTTNEVKGQLLNIIKKSLGYGTKKNETRYGYSGKFNTKAFIKDKNESYKWFENKAFENNGVKGNKGEEKVLNIWLDWSGSYCSNMAETNKILKALDEIEKENPCFKWNLIGMGDTLYSTSGNNRLSRSFGGNEMDYNQYKRFYNTYNKSGKELNIILFDGLSYSRGDEYAYEVFNNKHCVIISDIDNESAINRYCPNIKKKIIVNSRCGNESYANLLKENVCEALRLLF